MLNKWYLLWKGNAYIFNIIFKKIVDIHFQNIELNK